MLTEEEAEEIAAIVEKSVNKPAPKKRRHWPRTWMMLTMVLVCSAITHYMIQNTGAQASLQSFELVLAALFDSVFGQVREV